MRSVLANERTLLCANESLQDETRLQLLRDSLLVTPHGLVVISVAQIYSTKPYLRFCADSFHTRGVKEVCDSETSDNDSS